MSTEKHTPGPWTFLEDGDAEALHNCRPLTICSPGKDDLAEVFSDEDSTVAIPREQAIANARLIAAAPALAAALLALLPEVDSEIEQRKHSGNADDWKALERLSNDAHAALRAAGVTR